MTLIRLKDIICLAIPLMLAFASGNAEAASPAQSGQTVYVGGLDKPVELPVVFPPIKKIAPKPTEQELRTRADTGNAAAIEAYADFLPSPSDFPWYLKAAEGGSPRAMMIVANRAKDGKTGSGIDLPLSDKWMSKGLQAGRQALIKKDAKVLELLLEGDAHGGDGLLDPPTKTQYAQVIARAGGLDVEDVFYSVMNKLPDGPEKIQLLTKCSNSGHPWCTNRLAQDHLTGNEGLIIDRSLGIGLLTKVAQAGYGIYGYANSNNYEINGLQNLTRTEQIQLLKTAFERGVVGYGKDLATAYRDGYGVPKSAPVAAALLQEFVHRPDVSPKVRGEAIWMLANMYIDGKSFPVNEQLFLSALNLASSSDQRSRFMASGWLLNSEKGLLGNDTFNLTEPTKISLLKSVVEQNPPFYDAVETDLRYKSALRLGDLYSSGQKVQQSYSDAMTWYSKAEQIAIGSVDEEFTYDGVAAIKIGKLYEGGLGVAKDNNTSVSWYEKAANGVINHSANGPENLIELLNSVQLPKEDVDRLISFIRSSAQADNVGMQFALGAMYFAGKFVPQSYSEAIIWFDKCNSHSESAGHSDVYGMQCTEVLANMYSQGQGVMRDPGKAAYYYQRIFDLGYSNFTTPPIEDVLLPMYCGGEGIPIDRQKAFALLKKNADNGFSFNELGVGAMYQMGWGVGQDLAEAFNWYRKAAADKNYSSAKAKADLTRIFRDCKGTPENFNTAVSLYEKTSAGQH